jgi:hypothetical protein
LIERKISSVFGFKFDELSINNEYGVLSSISSEEADIVKPRLTLLLICMLWSIEETEKKKKRDDCL